MAKKKAAKANGKTNGNRKTLASQQSVNSVVKSICDIMRRGGCEGAMDYVPELTWMLFLRILDEREQREAEAAEVVGAEFSESIESPYRWRDWAAPDGPKRIELTSEGSKLGDLFAFVSGKLLPYLHKLGDQAHSTARQKVIAEIMLGVDRTKIDTEKNLQDVLDKVHDLSSENIDDTHVFTLSQVYEGLLLKMGERNNDGGQFFTPREIIRAIVQVVRPKIGETIYDPCCGTGGFLAQSFEFLAGKNNELISTSDDLDTLRLDTFFGREKGAKAYSIALANLMLHGIDRPNLWHGNTLTKQVMYDGLFTTAPAMFDCVLSNPPFGGKEGKEAQTHFSFKTGATQVLFLQHVLGSMSAEGRCGIVVDEGVLFRTNESAFVDTKRKLLDECDLYCIVSLPGGVFTAAGAGVKTNLLFFNRGKPTEKIWYYDLSDIKVGKKTPFTLDRFDEFFKLLPKRKDSDRSWTVDFTQRKATARAEAEPFHSDALKKEQAANGWKEDLKELKKVKPLKKKAIAEAEAKIKELGKEAREMRSKAEAIENAVFDLKAVNPNTRVVEDTRTPTQLIKEIETYGKEIEKALARLKS